MERSFLSEAPLFNEVPASKSTLQIATGVDASLKMASLPSRLTRGYSEDRIEESNYPVREKLIRLLSSVTLIFALALTCRVAFVLREGSLTPREVLASVPFENEAGNIAQALAQGSGFCCLFRQPTGPTAWLSPVYPVLLAGIFKIFGIFTVNSFYVAAILNCIFSSLATIPVYFTARRVGGVFCGAVAAWIWALFPSGIIMPFEWIWDTSLSALFAAILLWATLKVAGRLRTRQATAYGLLWGFSLLVNPALGSTLPFFLGWIAYRQWQSRNLNPKLLLLSLALAIVVCLPWTIRNAVQFERLIPLRSNFPFELWMGNNEIYDDHSREIKRITRYEQVRLYQQLGETAFLESKRKKAVAFIKAHPGLSLRLAGRRVIATWLGTNSPWRDFSATDSSLARFILLWNALTLIGVFVAFARLWLAHNPFAFPLVVFLIVFPLVYYITQTSLRLRHPCDPLLAILLVVAIALPSRKVQ
jgi:hypothetical protein